MELSSIYMLCNFAFVSYVKTNTCITLGTDNVELALLYSLANLVATPDGN